MPIRINLLAEAQAAEELRRKDPAKRALWGAAIIVVLMLGWSGILWLKIWTVSSTLSTRTGRADELSKPYKTAMENLDELREAQSKLDSLASFTSNRFLQAPMLDSLLHCWDPYIQVVHLRTEQSFEIAAATKAGATDSGRPVPGKSGSSTERIKLFIEAKDSSPNPGDEEITKYINSLAATPYFVAENISTNNIQMRITAGNVQIDADTGKPFVPFVLECAYQPRTR